MLKTLLAEQCCILQDIVFPPQCSYYSAVGQESKLFTPSIKAPARAVLPDVHSVMVLGSGERLDLCLQLLAFRGLHPFLLLLQKLNLSWIKEDDTFLHLPAHYFSWF